MSTNTKWFLIGFSAIAVVVVVFVNLPAPDSEVVEMNSMLAQDTASSGPKEEAGVHVGSLPGNESATGQRSVLVKKLDAIQMDSEYREIPGMLFDLLNEASLDEVHKVLASSDSSLDYSVGFRDEMKVAAFERWYHLDPASAIRALDASLLSRSRKDSRIEVYLENWASRSPQEVQGFLQAGALTDVSSDLVYGALARGSASYGDRTRFEDALGRIREPGKRFHALKSVARTLQRDHEDLFETWLPTLSSEDQATALAEGAWMLADKDIDRALGRLDQLNELEADELPVTRSRVVVKWTRSDPVKAGDWVLNQELSGEEQESLLALVLKVWVEDDRAAAITWVEDSIEQGKLDEAFMNRVAVQL